MTEASRRALKERKKEKKDRVGVSLGVCATQITEDY